MPKRHRVVKDHRWFDVITGAPREMDQATTDRLAERGPLRPDLAELLSLDPQGGLGG